MASPIDNLMTLWTWPWSAMRLASDMAETGAATHRVVAARLPMIAIAMQNPLAADLPELSRMVTEKVAAFGASGRSIQVAGTASKRAADANARALGSMAGGQLLWPDQWLNLFDVNVAAFAALAALPASALAPVHKGVTANDRRLGKQARIPS